MPSRYPETMSDPTLRPIRDKVEQQQRLSLQDGINLYRTQDLFTLGELANLVRERLHGRKAFYNINRHINYTNICVLRCKFCSFYRTMAADGSAPDDAYEMSIDEIADVAANAADQGATEVHIVGGLHPKLPFSYYLDMCEAIKSRCPGIHIKAFTALEIVHFSRIAKPRLSIREILTQLQQAGLGSLPGGGAEIFDDRVHSETFKNKVGEKHWFDVHDAAHNLGMASNATMLYGHVESVEERLHHLIKLREHQDASLNSRSASFNCCVPLSFIPNGSELGHLPGPTGLDDLKTLAITRLMLDNIPHVKAFWVMQSPQLSQVSLNWGVDDLDGTVAWYDITKRESHGSTRQVLGIDQLRRLITEAGCIPTERDTLYQIVHRDKDGKRCW